MQKTYDYVVVGAGSAGCVLANRLTEDGRTTVALVEAGGPDKKQEIHIPAAFSKLFKGPCDWAYFTDEQPRLNNRRLYWPRGKVLGGSSSLNAMIYTRGNRADFDWNDDWRLADAEPLFDRVLLGVDKIRTKNPLSERFIDACESEGIARNEDFNGPVQEGAGFFHVTQRGGKRSSTAAAYLKPALRRANLIVFTHTMTTRVLFDGTRAVGIECVQNGQRITIRAEREVILSGGAINSPQLLMLSGVGAADELRAHDIPVVTDLRGVGKNLQDHLVAAVAYECTQPISLAGAETIGNLLRYLLFKNGMLTSNVAEAGAFVHVRDAAVPDIELIFGPTFYMNHGFANPPGHGFSVGAILLHPKSSGAIRLRSGDPLAAPSIQPEYLADADDFALLKEGVELCLRIARSKAFDAVRGGEVWPGSAELEPFIRNTAETLYHPIGTCGMGTVVDSRLRVRGVDGLRVIDASVMPKIVTGHPNAAVVMIAERGADLIRAPG